MMRGRLAIISLCCIATVSCSHLFTYPFSLTDPTVWHQFNGNRGRILCGAPSCVDVNQTLLDNSVKCTSIESLPNVTTAWEMCGVNISAALCAAQKQVCELAVEERNVSLTYFPDHPPPASPPMAPSSPPAPPCGSDCLFDFLGLVSLEGTVAAVLGAVASGMAVLCTAGIVFMVRRSHGTRDVPQEVHLSAVSEREPMGRAKGDMSDVV